MKKVLSVFMGLVMAVGISSTALAEGSNASTQPTTPNSDDKIVVTIDNNSMYADAAKAIDKWESNKETKATATRASGGWIISSYRGSFLMWAEETVEFYYSGSRVTWSDAYQKSGWIFPNNVTNNGTSKIYTSSWNQRWRGSYTVGAGIPTPWGNANVYNSTSVITTNVYGDGTYNMVWDN